jgi:hypothetical protein
VGLMILDMLLGNNGAYNEQVSNNVPSLTAVTNKLLNKFKRPKNT